MALDRGAEMFDLELLDQPPHPFRHLSGAFPIGRRQEDDEFLSADAGDEVGTPLRVASERLGDPSQADVPGKVPVDIVVLFEIVDIDRYRRQRLAVTDGPAPLPREQQIEMAPVG
jgi:hypothetical protein